MDEKERDKLDVLVILLAGLAMVLWTMFIYIPKLKTHLAIIG